jgi:hypothetical protein
MAIETENESDKERILANPNPFIIVKPDGGRYLKELDSTIRENGVAINEIYFIEDWESVARSIYQKQLDSTSRSFYVGFESHVWLCQYLFGNNGLLLTLDINNQDIGFETKIQTVHETRESFRRKFPASNGMFTIAVNLEKFEGDKFVGSGKKKGVLGVMQSDSLEPLIESGSEGIWYRNYFKYIHAPENTEELVFQYSKLVSLNIMSEQNKISKDEWELLKFLRCVVPPSKYKTS